MVDFGKSIVRRDKDKMKRQRRITAVHYRKILQSLLLVIPPEEKAGSGMFKMIQGKIYSSTNRSPPTMGVKQFRFALKFRSRLVFLRVTNYQFFFKYP